MHVTVEAVIEPGGHVRLAEPIALRRPVRALVTILDDDETAQLMAVAETALSDWDRPEEDEAWAHLQPGR